MQERTVRLIGNHKAEKAQSARVAVFGLGGVGGYVAEALARGGVGAIDLIDHDKVSQSNLNRQLVALRSTLGKLKVEVMMERILDINPHCAVTTYPIFYLPENAHLIDFTRYDYVADAVDTVAAKINLIERCKEAGVPVISAMGTGNKLNPYGFQVADIADTSVCPLARVMRKELKHRGIEHVKVVYSQEEPLHPLGGGSTPGSMPFVPGVAGLIMAGEILKAIWECSSC